MTILTRTPANPNFLQPEGFIIAIRRLPTTTYFSQQVYIPGFATQATAQPTPFVKLPIPGDHIEFEDLSFTFKIDENMQNFMEIYNWMQGIGYPDDFQQYADLKTAGKIVPDTGVYSDISVIITTNLKNPNVEFLFKNAFPVSIAGFTLDTTDANITELSTTVTFKYEKYDIQLVN